MSMTKAPVCRDSERQWDKTKPISSPEFSFPPGVVALRVSMTMTLGLPPHFSIACVSAAASFASSKFGASGMTAGSS